MLDWLTRQLRFQELQQKKELDIYSVEIKYNGGNIIASNTFKTMDGDPLKVAMLTLSSPTFGNKNVKELKSLKEEEPINETDPNIIKTKEQVEYEKK